MMGAKIKNGQLDAIIKIFNEFLFFIYFKLKSRGRGESFFPSIALCGS